jgi:threonine/homoserine/homoserine lactone efflux protein
MIAQLSGFLAVSAVVIGTPGPDTFLTIRNSLAAGRHAGISTSAGVSAGQLVWTASAGAGMITLITASRPVFMAVRITGATYLLFLGVRSIWTAIKQRPADVTANGWHACTVRWQTAFGQGIFSNLSNPKMAAFFLSLLPQFTGPGGAPEAVTLGFGLVFAAMTFVWLAVYATVAARAGQLLGRPRASRLLNGICGMTLAGLGLWLVVEAG